MCEVKAGETYKCNVCGKVEKIEKDSDSKPMCCGVEMEKQK